MTATAGLGTSGVALIPWCQSCQNNASIYNITMPAIWQGLLL